MLNDMHGRNFIPVAEEYIRKGLIDQAIDLLKEGVEIYPGYLSARVSLGKAYLEKGMINEAMQEFEHVVRVSPDNLLAHRKLAFLYQEAGKTDSAIKSCEAVLIFSPRDKEISELLRMLKSERIEAVSRKAAGDDPKAFPSAEGAAPAIDFTSGWEVASEETKPGGFQDEFVTESMGDICIAQGEKAKGIEIFKKILQKDPDNESVRGKLTALGEDISPPLEKGGEGGFEKGGFKEGGLELKEKQAARLSDFLSKVRTNRR